jgi:hypothetical protein
VIIAVGCIGFFSREFLFTRLAKTEEEKKKCNIALQNTVSHFTLNINTQTAEQTQKYV